MGFILGVIVGAVGVKYGPQIIAAVKARFGGGNA